MNSTECRTRDQRRALIVSASVGFLDAIGLGVIIPLLPFVVLTMSGSAALVTQLVAIFAFAGFAMSPILGKFSDQYGRRPVILSTLVGSSISYVGMAFTPTLLSLFVFRAIGGAMTGRDAVAQALATDGIPPEQTMRAIGIISAARGIGLAMGPVLGGGISLLVGDSTLVGDSSNFRITLLAAATLTVGTFIMAFVMLPKQESQTGGASFQKQTTSWFKWALPLFLTGSISYGFGVIFSTTALFVNAVFEWKEFETGILLGLSAGIVAFSRLVLARRWVERWGAQMVTSLSLLLAFASLVLMGTVAQPTLFVLGFAGLSLGYGLVLVITTVMITHAATPDERGWALGLNQAATILALVVSAVLNGPVFNAVSPFAPFLIGALVLSAGIIAWLQNVMKNSVKIKPEGDKG